jgi:hypothetical protein
MPCSVGSRVRRINGLSRLRTDRLGILEIYRSTGDFMSDEISLEQYYEMVSSMETWLLESVPPNGYYVLRLGDREIGGESRSALERYARKEGFKVTNA